MFRNWKLEIGKSIRILTFETLGGAVARGKWIPVFLCLDLLPPLLSRLLLVDVAAPTVSEANQPTNK